MHNATKSDSRNGVVLRGAIEEALPGMDHDHRRLRLGLAQAAEDPFFLQRHARPARPAV